MYATLMLVLMLPMGLQEPDDAADYRTQHARYTDIFELTDDAEKATLFMDFVDEGFDERLLGALQAGIQDSLVALSGAGNDELYPLSDRWDSQTSELSGAAISLQTAAGSGNNEMIVKYGEIVYQVNPIIDIAQILAVSYSTLGNNPKYLDYANVVINDKGVGDAFDFSYNIFQQELAVPNLDTAADWAMRLAALGSAPAGVTDAEWGDMGVEFQTTIARSHYEGERWRDAMREYTTLGEMDRGLRGLTLFYRGQCHLKLEEFPEALDRFADASVVNDTTYSSPSRAMVEEIYSTNTGGTLDGLQDNVIGPARFRMR